MQGLMRTDTDRYGDGTTRKTDERDGEADERTMMGRRLGRRRKEAIMMALLSL
jgi:hypothetical protein